MTRPWPYPDLRNGTTIHHVTDTHFGTRYQTSFMRPRIADDLTVLRATHAGHIHTGDMIDWSDTTPEDAAYLAWRDKITGADSKPFVQVVGNHDLQGFTTKQTRTSQQWAGIVGLNSFNTVTDIGDVRVLGMGPDSWALWNGEKSVLSGATLTWLDEQLTAAGSRPCVIATHVPPDEQYVTYADYQQPQANLDDIVGAHDNVLAWLSGHRHINPLTEPAHATVATIGGKQVACINGPAAGASGESESMWVTFLDSGDVDIRWRSHLKRQWFQVGGASVGHLLLSA